jgi:hypothetical protein
VCTFFFTSINELFYKYKQKVNLAVSFQIMTWSADIKIAAVENVNIRFSFHPSIYS